MQSKTETRLGKQCGWRESHADCLEARCPFSPESCGIFHISIEKIKIDERGDHTEITGRRTCVGENGGDAE